MRVNRAILGWGLFFVVLGAVPLAVRQGLVGEEVAARAWTAWPVLLILAGAGLVLRRTPVAVLADLLIAATFGLIAGGLLAAGSIPFASCGDERGSVAFPAQSGELGGGGAVVEIELGCGNLTVQTAAGSGWSVEGVDEDGRGPQIETAGGDLAIESSRDVATPFGAREAWTVTLPTDVSLDLEAEVNAGVGQLDLAGATLRSLSVSVNAGEATIDLGGVEEIADLEVNFNAVGGPTVVLPNRSLTGSIEANAAGGVRLCPPAGAGLRLTVNDNVTASNNYAARGLVRSGDVWETTGFDTAEVRIDLRTEVNAGSFELQPEGVCDG